MKALKGILKPCQKCRESVFDKVHCSTIMHYPCKALCIFRETMKDHPRFRINFTPEKAPWLIRWVNKLIGLYCRQGYHFSHNHF